MFNHIKLIDYLITLQDDRQTERERDNKVIFFQPPKKEKVVKIQSNFSQCVIALRRR
jgi:hypothetical protein